MTDQELVDNMERVWRSIASLCSPFTEQDWKTPTDCPGWSVQDQVSHLAGSECRLLGRPAPDHTPEEMGHVKNDTGRRNEVVVDWRRPRSGAEVLEEFHEVTAERIEFLRALTPEDFAAETQTPIGVAPVRDLIQIRIFDAWVHGQDIRRAVRQAGDLEGPVAEHSVGRVAMALPYVVAKKAQAADGATVVFEITGPAGRVLPVVVEGTRARALEQAPAQPTVSLTMDTETFACLGCGRWAPGQVLGSGKVKIQGDRGLGETIVGQMNFMI
jgi:uncharacterized protein (TIGR03083 family)